MLGEHGITAYDWNIVAGVYIQPEAEGCSAKLIVEGSKDIGFKGDATAANWTQIIFQGMKQYFITAQISNPDKKQFEGRREINRTTCGDCTEPSTDGDVSAVEKE